MMPFRMMTSAFFASFFFSGFRIPDAVGGA
jgi:hypothetical protein